MLEHLLREPSGESGGQSPRFDGNEASSPDLVERFLDNQLDENDRVSFAKSLETDGVLAGHVALQQRIDATLRGRLGPSEMVLKHIVSTVADARDPNPSAEPSTRTATPKQRKVNWIRVAALVAVAVSGYFTYSAYFGEGAENRAFVPVAPSVSFQREVAEGMQPYAVCTTTEEFATYTRDHLGVALKVRPVDGLAIIGWDYDSVFSRRTMMLLAKYHDQPVIVFIDKISSGPDNTCIAENEANRIVGPIFLHEVRAPGVPSVLDAFEVVK